MTGRGGARKARQARQSVDVRREEILRATVDEVQRRGFASTRATDVATSLGVSPALLFYHFGSKDQMLSAAFSWAAERDLARLDVAARDDDSAVERLRRVLQLYSPVGASAGWTLWIDAWSAALRVPELRTVSRRLDVRWKDAVAEVITHGVGTGEFSCDDPSAAAWRITALLDGLGVQVTVHRGVLTRRQMHEWVGEFAARELGIEPSMLVTPARTARSRARSGPDDRSGRS